jgi:hypothetical protein
MCNIPAGSPGVHCTSHDQCTAPNSHCDVTMGRCVCAPGFPLTQELTCGEAEDDESDLGMAMLMLSVLILLVVTLCGGLLYVALCYKRKYDLTHREKISNEPAREPPQISVVVTSAIENTDETETPEDTELTDSHFGTTVDLDNTTSLYEQSTTNQQSFNEQSTN